ncbi:MAG: (2Fe-2S) ferredoxin domain-containing protein [Gammaproteobacteria bacterium]|nr:(2Fe-2S) ferredoxin domain-containing protein [Gammaproteobacteria bacterium]
MCMNQRDNGRQCCADNGGVELYDYAKRRIKELEKNGRGKVRINSSGCLDRCRKGSVIVVYPEGVWYSLKSKEDVEEVVQTHLIAGNVATSLLLD